MRRRLCAAAISGLLLLPGCTAAPPDAGPSPGPAAPAPAQTATPFQPSPGRVSFSRWSDLEHYGKVLIEVNSLTVYRGRLYAAIGPLGEWWSYDGSEWTLAFTHPTPLVPGKGRFVSWFPAIFRGELVYPGIVYKEGESHAAIVRFDGATWQAVEVPEVQWELFGVAELDGRLFIGTQGGKVYSTSDLRNLALEYQHPDVNSWLGPAEVYQGKLYFANQVAPNVAVFDGVSWSLLEVGGESTWLARAFGRLYIGLTSGDVLEYDGARLRVAASFQRFPDSLAWPAVIGLTDDMLLVSSTTEWEPETRGGRGATELWLSLDGYGFQKVGTYPSAILTATIFQGSLFMGTVTTVVDRQGVTGDAMREVSVYALDPPFPSVRGKYVGRLYEAASLGPGAASALADSRPVRLDNATALAVTVEATYWAGATAGVRVHLRTSTDGREYDTVDWQTIEPGLSRGATVRQTFSLPDAGPRWLRATVENLDGATGVRDIRVYLTVSVE